MNDAQDLPPNALIAVWTLFAVRTAAVRGEGWETDERRTLAICARDVAMLLRDPPTEPIEVDAGPYGVASVRVRPDGSISVAFRARRR